MNIASEVKIVCLVRFGKREHIENFVKKGEMKFSTLESFRGLEDRERGDESEGAISILNEEFTKIEYSHPVIGKGVLHIVPGTLGHLTQYDERSVGSFSSYAVKDIAISDTYFIDKRMLEFGDYAVVIPGQNLPKFFSRVRSKLDTLKIRYGYKCVTYRDFEAPGEIASDIFTKSLKFSHQSEHRIVVALDATEPLFINIGSLEDIAIMGTAKSWIETKFTVTKRQ